MARKSGLPFQEKTPGVLVHCAYHKMGTIWLTQLLRGIASKFDMTLEISNNNGDRHNGSDILIANHSQLCLEDLGDYVGSHMIRDPRDAVVSAYYYHLWTDEAWVHQKSEQYGGRSYQEFLNGMNEEEGLAEEIRRFETYIQHYRLQEWDYQNPRILEIRYESLIADEQTEFRKLFEHYGFSESAIKDSLELAESLSFKNVAKRKLGAKKSKSHLRSGKPNQWVEILNSSHRQLVKSLWGDLLIQMGYENDLNW